MNIKSPKEFKEIQDLKIKAQIKLSELNDMIEELDRLGARVSFCESSNTSRRLILECHIRV